MEQKLAKNFVYQQQTALGYSPRTTSKGIQDTMYYIGLLGYPSDFRSLVLYGIYHPGGEGGGKVIMRKKEYGRRKVRAVSKFGDTPRITYHILAYYPAIE